MGKLLRHLALICLGLASAAQAEWLVIDRTDTGATMAMDASRIRTVGNRVQAWVQFDHSRDRGVSYRKSLELWSFDCNAQTMKVMSVVRYDSYGKVVSSQANPSSYGDYGYAPITPDSLGEGAFKVACADSGTAD